VDQGRDPLGERTALREAETVKELCVRFEEEHVSRKRPHTQAEYKSALQLIERELGKLKVADVRFENVAALHRKMTKGQHRDHGKPSPYQANRTIAVLSKMMAMAMRWRMRTDNPCRGIERNHEDKRERYLSDAELERLTAALDAHRNQD